MNTDKLWNKLVDEVRKTPSGHSVPHDFEKRIMDRLNSTDAHAKSGDSSKIRSLDLLWSNLVNLARQATPNDRVPFAFEKRIMACIDVPLEVVDGLTLWSRALLTLLLGLLSFTNQGGFPENQDTIAVAFEEAVMAPIDTLGENW